jgi:DNA-binding response OmpR family regulator
VDVLVVDDNKTIQWGLTVLLEDEGFTVKTCPCGRTALELANEHTFNIYIVDYWLPEMKGVDVTVELRRMHPSAVIIGCSIEAKEQVFRSAGADAFILKENLQVELLPSIRKALAAM